MSKHYENQSYYTIENVAELTGMTVAAIQKRKERGEFDLHNLEWYLPLFRAYS